MKIVRQNHLHIENVPSTTTTLQGCALSVYELYKKMIVGSIDAAGYVRPYEYDDNPDIDHPDMLNTFGLDVGEVEEKVREQAEVFKAEKRKTAKQPDEEHSKETVETKPETPPES